MKTKAPRVLTLARIGSIIIAVLLLGSALLLPSITQTVQANPGIGYWIVVEGAWFHWLQIPTTYGCMQVYQILRGVGYPADRINYVAAATQTTFTEALVWASTRVTPDEPLWIYMYDHGNGDWFYLRGPTIIPYGEINILLNTIVPSNVSINVIVAACESGNAIDDLSASQRMIITSCRDDQNSSLYLVDDVPKWEAFSFPFWDKVKEYQNVLDSFNYACSHIKNVQNISYQDPLLDDNADGNGTKGLLYPSEEGEEGFVASSLYIGSHAYTPPVGGLQVPIDKFALLAPYLAFAAIVAVVTIGGVYARKRLLSRRVNRILLS